MPGTGKLAIFSRLAIYAVVLGWAVLTVLGAVDIRAVAAIESAVRSTLSTIAQSLPIPGHNDRGAK
jgi:hypothetical protein